MSCPNVNHPDWKNLVESVGEERAYVIFAENDNTIPTSVKIGGRYGNISDTLVGNPTLADNMAKSLRENFPDIDVTEHGVYDDEGNFRPIENRRGMHYRGAISAGVSWANDATLDTPPHEYAHDYILLYRNHPLVKAGLEKYGEELLVTYIGRYYANKKMSNSFQNWLQDFWSLIKSAFIQPNVLDQLSENFYKGEELTKKEMIGDGKIRNLIDKIDLSIPKSLKNIRGFESVASKIHEFTPEQIKNSIYNALQKEGAIDEEAQEFYKKKRNLNKAKNIEEAKKVIDSIIKRQSELELVTDPETGRTFYKNKKTGVEYKRTSSIVNADFVTKPEWAGATDIGTNIDVLIRNYFLGETLSYDDYSEHMTKDAFDELKKDLDKFKKQLDKDGIEIITGYVDPKTGAREEISLWDDNLGVAGTVDVIALDKDGGISIWDLKTIRSSLDFYKDKDEKGESKKLKHTKQLSMYAEMFENMSGNEVKGLKVIPIRVKYPAFGNVTSKGSLSSENIQDLNRISIDAVMGDIDIYEETDYAFNNEKFQTFIANMLMNFGDKSKMMFSNKEKNFAETDKRINKELYTFIKENPKSANRILAYIAGDKNIVFNTAEQKAYNTLENIFTTNQHYNEIYDQYIDESGYKVDREGVDDKSTTEISNFRKKKDKMFNRNPFLKKMAKIINNVLQYAVNSRLLTKYISGAENTTLSNMVYKTMERAQNDFHDLVLKVQDAIGKIDSKIQQGSTHLMGTKDINKLNTETFTLQVYKNKKDQADEDVKPETRDVKLTIGEMLTLYSYMRQEDLLEELGIEGFSLAKLENRDTKYNEVFMFTEQESERLSEIILNDSALQEQVAKIDNAFRIMKEMIDPKLKVMEGSGLGDIKNYFPVAYGTFKERQRLEKNSIENLSFARLRLGGGGASLKAIDYFQAIDASKITSANYNAYAIPIRNALMMIKNSQEEFEDNKEVVKWLNDLEDLMYKYNDPSSLLSSRGDKEINRMLNKIQGNFAVAALAKNLGVVMKQQVSLQTAAMYIDNEFLAQSGESIGPLAYVSPIKLFKLLNITGFKGGDTKLPIEWGNLRDSELLREMMEVPAVRARVYGVNSIEIGETVLGQNVGEDNINLTKLSGNMFKNKDGSDILVSKTRLMKSITLMDSLTIMRLYGAAKLETAKYNPGMSAQEQKEVSQERLLELIALTQPTFDYSNRTGLQKSDNPIFKSLTMFTSATAKIQMILIDKVIDVINNPSKANIKSLSYALFNIAVLSSAILTSIDLLRGGLLYGFDDDDELYEDYLYNSIRNSIGTVHGIGIAVNKVLDKAQNKPWRSVVQTPHEALIQDGSDALVKIFEGDVGGGLTKTLEVVGQGTGLPMSTYTNIKNVTKQVVEN